MPIWSVEECGKFIYDCCASGQGKPEEIYTRYGEFKKSRKYTPKEENDELWNFINAFHTSSYIERLSFDRERKQFIPVV